MAKINKYDVIIVGGGVAGSTAGYILTKLGLKTLIIDKEIFPRKKLCGGLVSLKTLQLLKKIFREEIKSLKKKKIINYTSYEYEINYRMSKIYVKGSSEYPFTFIDREVYDNFLLQKAKDIGTEVLEGQTIQSINIDECKVVISDKKIFQSDFLIGADGANSIVRREFDRKGLLKKRRWKRNLVTGVEIFVDRKDVEKNELKHPIMSLGVLKWGYAWMFPNEEKLVIGLGGLNRKNKGKFIDKMHEWISCLKLNPKLIGTIYGHLIPFGSIKIIKPAYKGRAFLIGDAAGFVCPFFGEGLYFTKKTAELLATAIYNNLIDKIAIEKTFLWNLGKDIYPEMKSAMILRKICYSRFGRAFKYKFMGILMDKLMNKFLETIHGERSFKWLRRKKDVNMLELLNE